MMHHAPQERLMEVVVALDELFVPAHIDRVALLREAASNDALGQVLAHRTSIKDVVTDIEEGEVAGPDGAALCIEECDEALALLARDVPLTPLTMQVLAELRERRAFFSALVLTEDPSAFSLATLRGVYDNACAVINVEAEYATPKMIRRCRLHRSNMVEFLLNSSNFYTMNKAVFERHRKTAVSDVRILLADDECGQEERKFATRLLSDLGGEGAVSSSPDDKVFGYKLYNHIPPEELRAAAAADPALQQAVERRAAILTINDYMVSHRSISKAEGAYLGIKECNRGIQLLSTPSSDVARKVLAELLERRAFFHGISLGFDREGPKYHVEEGDTGDMCRQVFEDATSVVGMAPTYTSDFVEQCARSHRILVFEFLSNNRRVSNLFADMATEFREAALADINIALTDPSYRECDRQVAREALASAGD